MNIKMIKLLSVSVVAATTLTATPAQAQSANSVSSSVDALAGLSPTLSLGCDGVNFGVWRIPTRTTGGVTTITLTVSANTRAGVTTATAGGNTTGVGLAAGYTGPTAGGCTLAGSNNVSKDVQSALAGASNMPFTGSTHNGLPLPTAPANLRATLSLAGTGISVNGLGIGEFRVVGVLTIPELIVAGNYGGYRTLDRAELLATDLVPVTPVVVTP
jgi:hypothetical protein